MLRSMIVWIIGDRSKAACRALRRAELAALRASSEATRAAIKLRRPHPRLDAAQWHAALAMYRAERRVGGLSARLGDALRAVKYAIKYSPRAAWEFFTARPIRAPRTARQA